MVVRGGVPCTGMWGEIGGTPRATRVPQVLPRHRDGSSSQATPACSSSDCKIPWHVQNGGAGRAMYSLALRRDAMWDRVHRRSSSGEALSTTSCVAVCLYRVLLCMICGGTCARAIAKATRWWVRRWVGGGGSVSAHRVWLRPPLLGGVFPSGWTGRGRRLGAIYGWRTGDFGSSRFFAFRGGVRGNMRECAEARAPPLERHVAQTTSKAGRRRLQEAPVLRHAREGWREGGVDVVVLTSGVRRCAARPPWGDVLRRRAAKRRGLVARGREAKP